MQLEIEVRKKSRTKKFISWVEFAQLVVGNANRNISTDKLSWAYDLIKGYAKKHALGKDYHHSYYMGAPGNWYVTLQHGNDGSANVIIKYSK